VAPREGPALAAVTLLLCLRKAPHDRQAQPCPACRPVSRRIDPIKPVEHVRQVLRGDPRSRVGHGDHDLRTIAGSGIAIRPSAGV